MKIVLLHYAYTPVIGGVEFVIDQHAALFARNGHEVRVVCGAGESKRRDVAIHVIGDLLPDSKACVASQEALKGRGGAEHPAFCQLKRALAGELREQIEGSDIVFVHNLMTMHFNLAATAALWELAREMECGGVRFVNWVHDLAAVNPDYQFPGPETWPWTLMRREPEGFSSVAISAKRRSQFTELTGVSATDCPVVSNGVEHLRLLRLSENIRGLVRRFGVLYRDVVLIHPTRILRRKNIEFGIRVLGELKNLGASCLYLVTGAADPHNAEARQYGGELKQLVGELGLEREVLFLSEEFPVEDEDLIGLYQVSDALFLPSRQEGFGLPILEAALFRIPVFCPGIEPMRSILRNNVHCFEPDDDSGEVAIELLEVLGASRGFLSRKEVMRKYSWDRLYREIIEPLFFAKGKKHP